MVLSKSNNIIFDPDVLEHLQAQGLDPDVIAEHQRNVSAFIEAGSSRFFSIRDTCRLDNGGIVSLPQGAPNKAVTSSGDFNCPIVAFVPAAGASSRYLAPLAGLMRALQSRSRSEVMTAVHDLEGQNLQGAPLPMMVRQLFSTASGSEVDELMVAAEQLLAEMDAPKALYPAVASGETFLEIKRCEHRALGMIQAEIYVAPPGRTQEFLTTAQKVASKIPVRCYEQGASLSTVRFDVAGHFVRSDSDQGVSLVPGGHGTLIRLFKRVHDDFPKARGLFIRNIDNISGTSNSVVLSTRAFLEAFQATLQFVDNIRFALRAKNQRLAADRANELLQFWNIRPDSSEDPLVTVHRRLFHSPSFTFEDLPHLFERPFVLMGQVPNTGNDVGGSCVFGTVEGVEQKLCLELPHASPDDKRNFLDSHGKATHFNPVFVAAELPAAETATTMEKNPFWLVVKKKWDGRDVYYQESILYELLGSSQFTNAIFVEVPRLLFNPHKTLSDARGRHLLDWIPS